MNLFVPDHLRNLQIVDKLCNMLEKYSDDYYSYDSGSFSDYDYCLKLDAVKRFIIMNRPDLEDEDKAPELNYISAVLYSSKGTREVFSNLEKYLGIKFEELEYSPSSIRFKLEPISTSDEGAYFDSLEECLAALLYFEGYTVKNRVVVIEIDSKINTYLSSGSIPYSYTKIDNIYVE